MKNKLIIVGILALSLAVFGTGCDDDPPAISDAGITDIGTGGDMGGDGTGITGRQYVVKSMMVPIDDATSKQYGYDIDGDGNADNALGAILTAIKNAATGIDMQKDMNQNILNGNVILLMALNATDYTKSSSVTLQGWTGEKTTCCTTKPCSDTDASKTCFSGTHTFKIDSNSPTASVLQGSIDASKFAVSGTIEVLLPIGKFPTKVKLIKARVDGTVATSGVTGGRIMGAITQSELKSAVIPSVAKVLDGEMKDTTTSQANRDAIKAAFDTDKDGNVTAAEVEANPGVKALMSGDVDADGDGKKEELSAGVGFTAVGCTISSN